MESLSSPQRSAEKKKPSPIVTTPSSAKVTSFDQIATPEKTIHILRRTRNRSVAFSVKEVKQIAITLQSPDTDSADRAEIAGSVDDPLLEPSADLGRDPVPRASKAKTSVKLPEKYEPLLEFFNSMESSVRLLRLKGSMSTFPNICTSIQHLTERRFTYGHLAQLKYILPEAISINKVLLRDPTTCCMKPELQVTLQIGAIRDIKKGKAENDYSLLRRIFRERLVDFSTNHPEGDDVPEEMLPHPFSQTKSRLLPNIEREPMKSMSVSGSVEPLSNNISHLPLVVPSHMPGTFQRRFSQKSPLNNENRTSLACLNTPLPKEEHPISIPPSIVLASRPPVSKKSLLSSPSPLTHDGDTKKLTRTNNSSPVELNVLKGTPAKLVSTPARLMTTTPEIQTPKRHRPTMDYQSPSPKKSSGRSTRTKLFTTPKKDEKTDDDEKKISAGEDIISFLPKNLLQSIKEKERKALEDRETGVAQKTKRQKLISCLHSMFDMILLIFQSRQSSIMTKQELIHKIITSHLKIVDRGEVEEQLKLLQELVPDWISENVASSGDILYSIDKMLNPEEIRQRLAEAAE